MNRQTKFICNNLLLAIALTIFVILALSIGLCITIAISFIGRWTGLNKDIFIYAVSLWSMWKSWDILSWVICKISDRAERKCEQKYSEQLNNEKK